MTERLARLFEGWEATDPVRVADTKTSRVFRVRRTGGTAVVKDLKPVGLADELRGADLLSWRDGRGYVRLLAREDATLLLEDAGTHSLLAHLDEHGDDAATAIAAGALREMHAPSGTRPPSTLRPLDEWFVSLFQVGHAGNDLMREAASVARELIASQRGVRPLHGDLHHENVLLSPRGWLAIDPKGLLGDPAYDAANMFCNPLDRDNLRLDPGRVRRMAAVLGAAVERDAPTILRWAFAYACLSAAWHLEDGEEASAAGGLAVAATVRSVGWGA